MIEANLRDDATATLSSFFRDHRRVFVLTGAGCSTASGIPDYRDDGGQWKRTPPIQIQEFLGKPTARRRYWARSYSGWPVVAAAEPSAAHKALARLGRTRDLTLITQNVDGLHQRAGSSRVVDLHGRLDRVVCLDCSAVLPRETVQTMIAAANPTWPLWSPSAAAPDGDADLEGVDYDTFDIPDCPRCGGVLKPDVVFFGENVPKPRVSAAYEALEAADGVLVVGSSLMVYSGYRFIRAARAAGKPIVALNRGRTRADGELSLKIDAPCEAVLPAVAAYLG